MNTTHYLIAGTIAVTTAFSSAVAQAKDSSPYTSSTFGTMTTEAQAERTIEIKPETRWVNVKRMETVRFVNAAGGSAASFAWRFDARTLKPFSLGAIAPEGFGVPQVTVYVAPSRLSR